MRFNEAKKVEKFMMDFQKDIPSLVTIMGTEAQTFFTKNFVKQGFDDNGVIPWKSRKRDRMGWAPNRAILVKSGALRRSLKILNGGKYSVYITSNLPYANVHNEGLRAGRGKGFIMPKRKFVGDSHNLMRIIERKLLKRIDFVFKRN